MKGKGEGYGGAKFPFRGWTEAGGLYRASLEWSLPQLLVICKHAIEQNPALTPEFKAGTGVKVRDDGGPFGPLPQ